MISKTFSCVLVLLGAASCNAQRPEVEPRSASHPIGSVVPSAPVDEAGASIGSDAPNSNETDAGRRAGEGAESFEALVQKFVHAWDTRDHRAVDRFLDEGLGIWVLWNPGVGVYPYHYASLSAAVADSPGGFTHFADVKFQCSPSPGPAPGLSNCNANAETDSKCKFGRAKDNLHAAFDMQLSLGLDKDDEAGRKSVERERARVVELEKAELQFLSDSAWGAVFYFARVRNDWRLIALDVSDCSA